MGRMQQIPFNMYTMGHEQWNSSQFIMLKTGVGIKMLGTFIYSTSNIYTSNTSFITKH